MSTLPAPIAARLGELERLCADHEKTIPVKDAAAFLGVKADCLRHHIERGRAPFAIGGEVDTLARHFVIPTATFYFWYIQGARL
jgi:hypothetical protein